MDPGLMMGPPKSMMSERFLVKGSIRQILPDALSAV